MFKIGDFSRLSRVSVRALRLYDQLGLLKPIQVDPFTGYRYYSAEQLPQLNRIVAFKDLGFSLEQIAELLSDQIPPAQIRGMLRLKQAEVQQRVEAEQTRLARIDARLQQIEQAAIGSTYDIVLKPVDAQPVATIRDVLPSCTHIGYLHAELQRYLYQRGIEMFGFPQSLWHDPEFGIENVDVEAIAPINQLFPTEDRIQSYILPAVEQMACVIHHGHYDTIFQAFNALLTWIETNQYAIAGVNREIYLHPTAVDAAFSDTDSSVIEIQFPVCQTKKII